MNSFYEANKKKMESILLADNVEESIKENEEVLFDLIPELRAEKGFDQKSPWHCYDVWDHTIHAIKNSVPDGDIRVVLLLHDIGKPFCYREDGDIRHFRGHAGKSAEIAELVLRKLGYPEGITADYCFLIRNHATTITEDMVNSANLEQYKKLLYIQYCDSGAYAPKFAKEIREKLDAVRLMLDRI